MESLIEFNQWGAAAIIGVQAAISAYRVLRAYADRRLDKRSKAVER